MFELKQACAGLCWSEEAVLRRVCWLQPINAEGKNVVPEVWEVLDKIKGFSDKVPTLITS